MSIYTNQEMAMLFDSSKCTACKGCQVACKQWNTLPSPLGLNEVKFTGSYQAPLELNGDTRLLMTFDEKESKDKFRPVEWAFGRRSCYHCSDPGCVQVCPSGCLQKQDNGFVTIDPAKCIGCKYCEAACPFEVPKYRFDGKVDKCTMCYERLDNGKVPACVQTCQPEALFFGPREEVLQKAKARVEVLKNKGFNKAEVYGENELGGLHVIHVCKYGHEAHGLPTNPEKSTMATISSLASPATGLAVGATVAGLALSFIAGMGYRRKKVSAEEAYQHWDARQQAESDKKVADRLLKDEKAKRDDAN